MMQKLGKIGATLAVAGTIMTAGAAAASATDWTIKGTFGTGAACEAEADHYYRWWTEAWCEEKPRSNYWILWVKV
ncbi:hypothetical protein AB5J62_38420 [Amycolatopsis sp. cg5]|uniref:hypothetical protein n=1 Tax=Amycolatopsis sp. cg5 TaxID=3238802 RepID=UPI003523BB65